MKVWNLLTFLIVSSVALASELRGDQRVKSSARQKRALAADDPENLNFFHSCENSCHYSHKSCPPDTRCSKHVATVQANCYKLCMSNANQREDSHNPAWKCQRGCNREFGFKITNARALCFSRCYSEANYSRKGFTFVKGRWQSKDGGKPPGQ